jgi:hypothetical protein
MDNPKCMDDPTCRDAAASPMRNPTIKMVLRDHFTRFGFTGDKKYGYLVTQKEFTNRPNTAFVMNFNDELKKTYTGYLQAKSCIVPVGQQTCEPLDKDAFKWAFWVDKGVAHPTSTSTIGIRRSYFRPWIPPTPADAKGETPIGPDVQASIPWSDVVTMRVCNTYNQATGKCQ